MESVEQQAILKKKQDTLKAAKMAFMSNRDKTKLLELMDAMEIAENDLSEYEDSLISPEQLKAQKAFDEAKLKWDAASKALEDAKAALKAAGGKVNGGQGGGDHARYITYEQAQEIRKDFAGGMKIVDITKKYGNSTSSVGYIVNYLQHKLRKGDKAHTPLINKFYPKKWKDNTGMIRSGAPYVEDGVKETNERYKGYKEIV